MGETDTDSVSEMICSFLIYICHSFIFTTSQIMDLLVVLNKQQPNYQQNYTNRMIQENVIQQFGVDCKMFIYENCYVMVRFNLL